MRGYATPGIWWVQVHHGLPFHGERLQEEPWHCRHRANGVWEVISFLSKMFPLQTHWQMVGPLIRDGANVWGHRKKNVRVFNHAFHSLLTKWRDLLTHFPDHLKHLKNAKVAAVCAFHRVLTGWPLLQPRTLILPYIFRLPPREVKGMALAPWNHPGF